MNYNLKDYKVLKTVDISKWNPDIYFSYEWIDFLKKSLNVDPFVIEISDGNKIIGYFVGAVFKKFGVKIVGSPFRGWDTPYMGLLIDDGYSRIEIINDIWIFCKKNFKCLYMEVCDRNVVIEELKNTKIKYIVERTYSLDITKSEEDLLNSFTKHCRKDLRLFVNRGASIKKVECTQKFIDEFYQTLIDVFKVQNLNPPYSKQKLEILFNSIKDDNMLCLETYNPDGKCIGRSVSFGFMDYCYAFASGTDRNENYNQKNFLRWEAIRYWKSKGKKHYDLMGVRKYKLEFNPKEEEFYRLIFTKYKMLLWGRNIAQKLYWKLNKIKFSLKKRND